MEKIAIFYVILILVIQGNVFGGNHLKSPSQYYLFVGAYTQNENEGIYVFKFDASDGDLEYITTVKGVKNPSYLALNKKKNLLIAVNETGEFQGEKTGSVSSFRINSQTGNLQMISQVSSGGGSPCYVSMNKSANMAFVANYSGGNISTFLIQPDGKLNGPVDLQQHAGSGPVVNRQKSPHAHAIVLNPKETHVMASDLGIDKIISYEINKKSGVLMQVNEFVATAGAGPRHLTFHPKKAFAFIINELNSTITSCSYTLNNAGLTEVMTVSSLPSDFQGDNSCADIHVSPGGAFLYGSNRGHDSIVIYKIDQNSGKLEYVDHQNVKGETPRNFMIDPTGKFLLVANQNTNNIVVFKIDQENGKLKSNGVEVEVSKPVCLKMIAIE